MDTEIIEQEFAKGLIKTRKGGFGNELSYVETPEYIKRLNSAFDYQWSFEVLDERIESGFVVVKGKLTAEGISKVQYGTSQVTVNKKSGDISQIGDDYKSAASDALKKCCSLFGIGLHLYTNGDSVGMSKQSGNKGNGKVTKAQLAKIKTLRTKAGMSSDDVLDLVERMFSTRDPIGLNSEMGAAIIAVLENKLNGNGQSQEEVV